MSYELRKAILLEAGFARFWGSKTYSRVAGNVHFRNAFMAVALERRAEDVLTKEYIWGSEPILTTEAE